MFEPDRHPREGWAQAVDAADAGDIELDPYVPTEFDETEWEWPETAWDSPE